jgi:peroxiredoxin
MDTRREPVKLLPRGAFAPWFVARSTDNPRFAFNSLGGRWNVLVFVDCANNAVTKAFLSALMARRDVFDGARAGIVMITQTAEDFAELMPKPASLYVLQDEDGAIGVAYGVRQTVGIVPIAFVIDPMLRVDEGFALREGGALLRHVEARLAEAQTHHAPVLIVPRVFEAELCEKLIAYYHASAPETSGFMREVNGRTVLVHDLAFKSRADVMIKDAVLARTCVSRMRQRLIPMIERAWHWRATRFERSLIARYAAEDNGHFNPHRDNTTKGTAHRKFAVTINLNAQHYEGGDLRFPEFGATTYRASTGGAVVFGCSLLHEATPVTRGERFAYLPFLYDEEGARLREENVGSLDGGAYTAYPSASEA